MKVLILISFCTWCIVSCSGLDFGNLAGVLSNLFTSQGSGDQNAYGGFAKISSLLLKLAPIVSPIENINDTCRQQLNLALDGILKIFEDPSPLDLISIDKWEFKLLDAMGKPSDGIFDLNTQWLGNFDECMAIGSKQSNLDRHSSILAALNMPNYHTKSTLPPFRGEYCLVTLNRVAKTSTLEKAPPFKMGICFPSICSLQDKINIVNHYSTIFNTIGDVNENFCQSMSKTRSMDWLTAIIIVVLLAILFTVVVALTFDLAISDETKLPHLKKIKSIVRPFSIIKNLQKIVETGENKSHQHVEGFCFLAMIWILLGHLFLSLNYKDIPYSNRVDYITTFEHFLQQQVFTHIFAFELLFQIVTFLVSYELLINFQELGLVGLLPVFLRRFAKRVPTYMLIVSFMLGPMAYVGSGPLWPTQFLRAAHCRCRWWELVLFIFNFDVNQQECNPTYWYPSVDMQLLFVIPIFVYFIYKTPLFGLITIGALWIFSMILWPSVTYYRNLEVIPSILRYSNNTENYYDINKQVWGHLAPVLSGLLLAFGLRQYGHKIQEMMRNVWLNVTGWCVCIFIILCTIYATFPLVSSKVATTTAINAVYSCLTTHLWSLATAWLVLAANSKGILNTILNSKFVRLTGSSTYSAYLVHFFILSSYFDSTHVVLHFDIYNNTILYLYVLFFSYLLGLILTMSVEMPVSNLVEMWLSKLNLSDHNGRQQYNILESTNSENDDATSKRLD